MLNESTFLHTQIATDANYGSEDNPIMVRGVKDSEGPINERRFLNALAGPDGQKISYERFGSCCSFKSANGILGSGLLDMYQVTWRNQEEDVVLYINMYDARKLKAPMGFTIVTAESLRNMKQS